jgi:hypothetical protein
MLESKTSSSCHCTVGDMRHKNKSYDNAILYKQVAQPRPRLASTSNYILSD